MRTESQRRKVERDHLPPKHLPALVAVPASPEALPAPLWLYLLRSLLSLFPRVLMVNLVLKVNLEMLVLKAMPVLLALLDPLGPPAPL